MKSYLLPITRRTLLYLLAGWFMLPALSGCKQMQTWNAYENPVVDIIADLLPKTPEKRKKVIYAKLIDPDADVRREGVKALASDPKAAGERTVEIFSIMGQGDPDGQVRLMCIKSLRALKDETYLPAVVAFSCNDDYELIRQEVTTILAQTRFENNETLLIKMLNEDSSMVVRGMAATALGNYPSRKAVKELITVVGEEEFRIAFLARQSLVKLTGEDLEYDQAAWEAWYNQTDQPLLESPKDGAK